MKKIECYDVGGTKIRAALIEQRADGKDFNIVHLTEEKSFGGNFSILVEKIHKISECLRKNETKPDAVSLGFPGPILGDLLINAPPLKISKTINIRKKLEEKFETDKIFLGNDLNLAAKAELVYGEGKKTKNFYLLGIGTGIGVGIIINGEVLQNSCGEFGHDTLERDTKLANKCLCGRKGCWVAMASGYGIHEIIKKIGIKNIKYFFKRAEKGEERIDLILERIRDYNAQGIGNMLNAFSLDKIIVMGSVGLRQFEKIIPSKRSIEKYTINRVPEIKPTKLKEDIGIVGAYVHALESLGK